MRLEEIVSINGIDGKAIALKKSILSLFFELSDHVSFVSLLFAEHPLSQLLLETTTETVFHKTHYKYFISSRE